MAWRDGVEAYTCSRATQLSRRPRWALGLCQHPRGAPQLAAALGTSLHPRPPGETRHTGGGGGQTLLCPRASRAAGGFKLAPCSGCLWKERPEDRHPSGRPVTSIY